MNQNTTPLIHPSAKIHISAKIGPGVVIGANVEIDEWVVIAPYSVLGMMPEHADFYDDVYQIKTLGVHIKKGARIFEFVTIHAGTEKPTLIEENASVFQHSHIAHDCQIGKNATIGGQVSLAGHTQVMEKAIIGGKSCTHQHSIIGAYAFLSPMSYLKGHMPPGELWVGNPARPAGLNHVGLERANMTHNICCERFGEIFDALKRNSKL